MNLAMLSEGSDPMNSPKQTFKLNLKKKLGQVQNSDSQLSNAMSAQILPIEPQDEHQPIHRVPVNGLSTIVRFFK